MDSLTSASFVVFRLCDEWFALNTRCIDEVLPIKLVHTLPRRTNKILRGVVNWKGLIQLCISLKSLFNLKHNNSSEKEPFSRRMIAIQKENRIWVFEVDSVEAIESIVVANLNNVHDDRVEKTFIQGKVQLNDRQIFIIDEEMLFQELSILK